MNTNLHLVLGSVLLLIVPSSLHGAKVKQVAPAEASKGRVHEWKSGDGLAFQYFVPKSYDPAKGANLTFVLHGSDLTKTWGFANLKIGSFREDDIVVSPDGTTANGRGGYNFLGRGSDVERFAGLQKQLMGAFKVNATFLYGHSQGSFFALHYAGAKPELVQGVLAHASGLWAVSKRSEAGHHQAIVLMHGTQDPAVPYGQSVGGYETFLKAEYPMVRLRTLEGWNHWPAELNGPTPHVSQQLAWIEGMTTSDVGRLGEVFKTLGKPRAKERHDYAALYLVAKRVQGLKDLPPGAIRAADKAVKSVEALAAKHAAAVSGASPDIEIEKDDEAWIGHMPMFLRAFSGVPAADALQKEWSETLKKHEDAANQHLGAYFKHFRAGEKKEAFHAGLEALSGAFLTAYVSDREFLKNMQKFADSARDLGIDSAATKKFKSIRKNLRKSGSAGQKEFESINKRASL